MGKKLDRDENRHSIGALQSYFFEKERDNRPIMTKIKIVNKNTEENEKLEANITIVFDNFTQRVDIMWEDAGYTRDEFREKGLYGYYDCTWVPMDFQDGVLEVDSPDSDKIIYLY